MARLIKMPNFQGLTPNSKASISFPLGLTYEKVYIYLGTTGLTKAFLTNIVLKLNNKEFQRWLTAADLDILNTYKGNAINASYLVLDFTERLAKTEAGMKLGTIAACQEAGVQAFTMEMDVGAFTLIGGVAPFVFADVDGPSANRVIQRVQFQQKALSAAVQDNFYIPFGAQGYQCKRLILKHAQLTQVKIRRDGVDIYEDVPVALANFREQDYGRVPVAGAQVVDFMPDTLNSNALNTAFTAAYGADGKPVAVPVANLDARLTTAAADTISIYTEAFSVNTAL